MPSQPSPRAEIGIIGGSGLYTMATPAGSEFEEVAMETPWGTPSGSIVLTEVCGRRIAFLPRHGATHSLPPHRINYRANIWALHHLGVERVLAPCAVGSLRPEHPPGSVVIPDQFLNLTSSRPDTYFEGPEVAHLSAADPYCPELSHLAADVVPSSGLATHRGGTVIVISGPRFSTRAESRLYSSWGGSVINMTQYPEVVLARELGMCYVNLSLVTDYDAGLDGDTAIRPVTQEAVLDVFREATAALQNALRSLVGALPAERNCRCRDAPQPLGH